GKPVGSSGNITFGRFSFFSQPGEVVPFPRDPEHNHPEFIVIRLERKLHDGRRIGSMFARVHLVRNASTAYVVSDHFDFLDFLGSAPLKFLSQSRRNLGTSLRGRAFNAVRKEGTMGRVESYRRYAAQCLALSKQATNSNERELLVTMAQRWQGESVHVFGAATRGGR